MCLFCHKTNDKLIFLYNISAPLNLNTENLAIDTDPQTFNVRCTGLSILNKDSISAFNPLEVLIR